MCKCIYIYDYFLLMKYRLHKHIASNKSTDIFVTEHQVNNCYDSGHSVFIPQQFSKAKLV